MIKTVNDLLQELKGKDPEMPIGQALPLSVKMDIYDIYESECDKEDCIGYLKEMGYEAAIKDTDFMEGFVNRYRHKFDSEYGTWDNIAATMFYFKEDLGKYAVSGDESKGNDRDFCM